MKDYLGLTTIYDDEIKRREVIAKSYRHPRLFGFVYIDYIDQLDILEKHFKDEYRFDYYTNNLLINKIEYWSKKTEQWEESYKIIERFDYVFWGKHYATSGKRWYLIKCNKKYAKRMIKNGLCNHKKRRC